MTLQDWQVGSCGYQTPRQGASSSAGWQAWGHSPAPVPRETRTRFRSISRILDSRWFECSIHHCDHLGNRERLLDRQHRAQKRGVAQQIQPLGLTSAGHGDDAHARAVRQQLDDGLDAVLFRHVEVSDDQVAAAIAPQPDRLRTISRLENLVTRLVEQNAERTTNARVVVHDQNSLLGCNGHGVFPRPVDWSGLAVRSRSQANPQDPIGRPLSHFRLSAEGWWPAIQWRNSSLARANCSTPHRPVTPAMSGEFQELPDHPL